MLKSKAETCRSALKPPNLHLRWENKQSLLYRVHSLPIISLSGTAVCPGNVLVFFLLIFNDFGGGFLWNEESETTGEAGKANLPCSKASWLLSVFLPSYCGV